MANILDLVPCSIWGVFDAHDVSPIQMLLKVHGGVMKEHGSQLHPAPTMNMQHTWAASALQMSSTLKLE